MKLPGAPTILAHLEKILGAVLRTENASRSSKAGAEGLSTQNETSDAATCVRRAWVAVAQHGGLLSQAFVMIVDG